MFLSLWSAVGRYRAPIEYPAVRTCAHEENVRGPSGDACHGPTGGLIRDRTRRA